MATYLLAGNGFDVGQDFGRAEADTLIEVDAKAYARPGYVIGTIAGDPASRRGFMRRERVRIHCRKSAIVERDEAPAGYAAVRRGRAGETDTCFAYGDTLAECKAAAQRQLQVPDNQMGCLLYGSLVWDALTADQASECSSMLDADWVF